jgi:hypothetical protein
MSSEWPFRLHMYTEQQIVRYVQYCTRAKYSLVHIDATGGVLRKLTEQNQSYMYAVIFKDGDDTIDTIPLAHALLTEHTTISIMTFLGSVAQSIIKVKGKLISPAFFITDFSPAIMNATLLAFNSQSMQAHLHHCWNVVGKRYSAVQLRSSSFIHLCCCHVMNAIAKNLTDANTDKETRESVLYVFALILCETDMKRMYGILGSLVSIFGDPNNKHAANDLELLLAEQLHVDEESHSVLTDAERIFSEAKKMDDELSLVDEYFRSNSAIIHESPFNREAIRLYPPIEQLLNAKAHFANVKNPIFSRNLIRLIYKWWAYLPLWTGLLIDFKTRYPSDRECDLAPSHSPVRFSNALIESYFRTVKYSTLKKKRHNRPDRIIELLFDAIAQQLKAGKYGVTHSSKGRKRKKHDLNEEEEWGKKADADKRRSKYLSVIDKIKSKYAQNKLRKQRVKEVVKRKYVFLFFLLVVRYLNCQAIA